MVIRISIASSNSIAGWRIMLSGTVKSIGKLLKELLVKLDLHYSNNFICFHKLWNLKVILTIFSLLPSSLTAFWDLFPTLIVTEEVVNQDHTLVFAPNFGFLLFAKGRIEIRVSTQRGNLTGWKLMRSVNLIFWKNFNFVS